MPRYVFRVPLKGGRRSAENYRMYRTYDNSKGIPLEDVVINCGTLAKAEKLMRKQHDGTFWFLGVKNDRDQTIRLPRQKEVTNG